ncbi:MAG: STAS domain-containing protein [Steroidobacteraceae bacterium]
MTTTIESVAGEVRVTGEMTVYTASQIKQPLLDAIAVGPTNVLVDLSGVSEFDTAGVQLLLLVYREALLSGRTFRLGAQSSIVSEVLALCGVLGQLIEAPNTESRS